MYRSLLTCLLVFFMAGASGQKASVKLKLSRTKALMNTNLPWQLIQNGCAGNITQVDLFASELNRFLSAAEMSRLRSDLENDYNNFSKKAVENTLARYEREKRNANITKIAIEANKVKWEAIGEVVGDISGWIPEPKTRAVVKTTVFVGKKTLEYTTDYLKGQADDARRKSLDGLLYNMRRENEQHLDELEKNPQMDDTRFIDILFKSSNENKKFFESLETEDQATYVKHMQQELKDAVRRSELRNLGRDQEMARKIEENEKTMKKIEVGLKNDITRTQRNVEALQASQVKMQKNLDILKGRVDLNTRDLDFIKDYLYGKMSPAEKLRAIDEGWLNNLSGPEKVKEKAKLELLKAQEEFIAASKDYLSDAQNVLTIANNLGIKHPLLGKAQQGVDLLNTGLKAYMDFTSGNYLGAVASLSGIFGKKKSDPVMEKLAMMDKKLNRILENQAVMIAQLDQIQKGIDQILNGQKILYTTILDLSDRIDQQFNAVNEKLNAIHLDVLYNRNQVHYYSSRQNLNAIHSFIVKNRKTLDVMADTLPAYDEAVAKIITPNLSQLSNFEQSLYNIFSVIRAQEKADLEAQGQIFELPRDFKQTEFVSDNDPLKDVNQSTIFDLLRLDSLFSFFMKENNPGNTRKYFASYLVPFTKCYDLKKKSSIELSEDTIKNNEQLEEIINFLNCDVTSKNKTSRNNNYLEPRYLLEATNALANFYYLYSYLDPHLKTLSQQQVAEGRSVYNSKIDLLKNARFLINIGIAQQIMLSGDLLTPYMYQKLNKGLVLPPDSINTEEAQIQRLCMRIIAKNDLVRYNFMKYYIYNRLNDLKRNFANYSIGFSFPNAKYFQQVLQIADSVKWNDSSNVHQLKIALRPDPRNSNQKLWSYIVPTESEGDLFFPLPSSTDENDRKQLGELKENRIAYRNALADLLQCKAYLDAEISKIEYASKVSKEDQSQFNKLILLTNLSNEQ